LISFGASLETPNPGNKQMKKIAFVLAALAAIAFALPVTSADAKGMKYKHHHHMKKSHHHYHHHYMKKPMAGKKM
jgi:hypothetical protein